MPWVPGAFGPESGDQGSAGLIQSVAVVSGVGGYNPTNASFTSVAVVQGVSNATISVSGSIQATAAALGRAPSDDGDGSISAQASISGVVAINTQAAGTITAVFTSNPYLVGEPGSSGSISASASLTSRGRSRMVDKRTLGNKRAVAA